MAVLPNWKYPETEVIRREAVVSLMHKPMNPDDMILPFNLYVPLREISSVDLYAMQRDGTAVPQEILSKIYKEYSDRTAEYQTISFSQVSELMGEATGELTAIFSADIRPEYQTSYHDTRTLYQYCQRRYEDEEETREFLGIDL